MSPTRHPRLLAVLAAELLAAFPARSDDEIRLGGKKMKIDLRLLDDTSDASKSAQLVEQLMVQQKVHAVVGGYGSQLVQAQSVVPDRYGIPYVATPSWPTRTSRTTSPCSASTRR